MITPPCLRIRKLLIFLFLLSQAAMLSQTPFLDSLKTELNKARTDSARIYFNITLSEKCDINDIPTYAGKAVALCQNQLRKSKPNDPGYNFYALNLAIGINNLGFFEGKQGKLNRSKFYYQKSLGLYEKLNNKEGIANSLSNIASVYLMLSDIPKALEYYDRSVKIRELLKDKKGLAICFHNIGSTYEHMGEVNKAIEYYKHSLKLRENINDQNGIAHAYNVLGGAYSKMGNNEKALDLHTKSNTIWEKLNDRSGIALSLRCIASVQKEQKQYDKALENYKNSISISEQLKEKMELSIAYGGIADLMKELHDLAAARTYAEKSMEIAKEISFPESIKGISKILSEIYAGSGNYKGAYEMFRLHKAVSDSINKKSNEKALIHNVFKYAYEKKALEESAKADHEKILLMAKMKQKQIVNYALVIGIVLCIGFSVFILSRLKLINKQTLIIENQRMEVEFQKELAESGREMAEVQKQIAISSLEELKEAQVKLIEAKEEADKANQSKSEFVASMSHEIRTPLNAILGFSELLKGSAKEPKYERYIEGILTGGKNLLSLIDDILDLSKIEAGRMFIQNSPINTTALMNEIRQMFSPKCEEKGLQFKIHFKDKGFPHYLLLDETRIRQVIFNLIGNAIKFTHKGSVNFYFDVLGPGAVEGEVDLLIKITDTGIGIPKDQQNTIFEAFKQQDGQSALKYGGTGLGLAITKRLVEMMNGNISVESEPGNGSTFSVKICNVSQVNMDSVYELPSENSTYKFKGQTILVTEDIASNQEVVRGFLEHSDLKIVIAENGQEAIDALKTFEPDLILMDMMMPVMDGYTAAKHIRSDPKYRHIPILALTASALKQHESIIRDLCNDYLRKPISKNALIKALAAHLDHTLVINDALTGDTKDNSRQSISLELRNELRSKFYPEWKTISVLMSIDDISVFASKLKDFGTLSGSGPIKNYASLLQSYADNFEIDRMNFTFNKFPDLLPSHS